MATHHRPTHNEDEYFVKHDAELLKARRAQLDDEREKLERMSHYMKCPHCGADLVERPFHHVKVDVCPECRGVWMSGGELDMLDYVKPHELSRFVSSMFGMR